tara:strand:+ start:3197 stop:4375 length:1179 start_codon:yes stop_codon:yes gene_type:complete
MASFKNNINLMYLFQFFRNLHFISGVLVPFFLNWGKISFTQIMLLQSVFVISVFFLEVPTGAVADYFGRKLSLTLSAIINGLAVLIYSAYPNFYIFILGEITWAIGVALMSGANEALVYDSLKKIKKEKTSKKVFGRFMSFDMAALMISAPIGSYIASTLGLRYTMVFMAIPLFLAAIITLLLKEPKIKRKNKPKEYLKTMVDGVKYFKSHSILKMLAFDMISITVLWFFLIWTYQPLLIQLSVPILYFGFIQAGIAGIQIPVMNNLEKLEKLFGSKKRFALWSALGVGIGFILLGFITSIPIVILLFLLVVGFGGPREALFKNYLNKHIETKNRATVLSTVSMMEKLAFAVTYPIVGVLVDYSLSFTHILLGIIVIICAVASRVEEKHLID